MEPGCVCECRRNRPKAKDSSVHHRVTKLRRELPEPWTIDAISTAVRKTSTYLHSSPVADVEQTR